jgi:hypothetical protein
MGKRKVEEKNLDEGPVLFFVEVMDEEDLKFLYLVQTLRKFDNDEKPKVCSHLDFGEQIKHEDYHADDVNSEVVLKIIVPDLSQSPQSLALLKLNSDEIYTDLDQVKDQTKRLKS